MSSYEKMMAGEQAKMMAEERKAKEETIKQWSEEDQNKKDSGRVFPQTLIRAARSCTQPSLYVDCIDWLQHRFLGVDRFTIQGTWKKVAKEFAEYHQYEPIEEYHQYEPIDPDQLRSLMMMISDTRIIEGWNNTFISNLDSPHLMSDEGDLIWRSVLGVDEYRMKGRIRIQFTSLSILNFNYDTVDYITLELARHCIAPPNHMKKVQISTQIQRADMKEIDIMSADQGRPRARLCRDVIYLGIMEYESIRRGGSYHRATHAGELVTLNIHITGGQNSYIETYMRKQDRGRSAMFRDIFDLGLKQYRTKLEEAGGGLPDIDRGELDDHV